MAPQARVELRPCEAEEARGGQVALGIRLAVGDVVLLRSEIDRLARLVHWLLYALLVVVLLARPAGEDYAVMTATPVAK